MELADLGRLRCHSRRAILLRVLRAVSSDAGFSWANLLLFGIGAALLIVGLFRAFGRPQVYRGKISGSIFTAIAVLVVAFFSYAIFYVVRQVPASSGAPRVGQKAPDFILLDQNGKPVGLGDLLSGSRAVALIFYRGFW
jgi:hypothetical protein